MGVLACCQAWSNFFFQVQLSHVLQVLLQLNVSAVEFVILQVAIGEFESPEECGDTLCVVFGVSCNVLPKIQSRNA